MIRLLLLFSICILQKMTAQDFTFVNRKFDASPNGSRGVSIADIDGNGWLDIVVSNQVDSVKLSGNSIFLNEKGHFYHKAIAANRLEAWSESAHTVDIDNDHDLDLFFTTQFNVPNLLYRNDGSGNFTPMDAGELTSDPTNSPGACWCDYDLDGDLDVFVVNRDGADDHLYENNGAGKFMHIKKGPWIGNEGDGRSCAWGDINGDGRMDLYVANFVVKQGGKVIGKHRNYLYLGLENGAFMEQTEGIAVEEKNASYGVTLIDLDYDKDLDIYVTNVSSRDDNALYENSGGGDFQKLGEHTVAYATNRPSKGQTWGDFSNNGQLDLYIANGTEGYPEIQNYFFSTNKDASNARIYHALPTIDPHISAGTASGDLDNDGDLDLYVCNWGNDSEPNDCYINQTNSNQWIKFQLRGLESNSYGIGSWAFLTLDDGSIETRYFTRETGYGSENAPEIHFGIATPRKPVAIEIIWPSGLRQSSTSLSANTTYQVVEGEKFEPLERHEK